MTSWECAAITHPGKVRSINEDAIYSNPAQGVWAVADGMGGYAAGDVASRLIVQGLAELKYQENLDAYVDAITRIVDKVNRKLCFEITMRVDSDVIGSTVVIAVVLGARCVCLWAGDSRMYVLRGGVLYQVTKDHSLVQELVDDGALSEEEAAKHPQNHVITRAVGVDEEMKLEVVTFDLEGDDQLLLCSDGLYNEVDADQIVGVLTDADTDLDFGANPSCSAVASTPLLVNCESRVTSLLQTALDTEARDNISINLIHISAS